MSQQSKVRLHVGPVSTAAVGAQLCPPMVGRLGSPRHSAWQAAEKARGSPESRSRLGWQMFQDGSNGDGGKLPVS